MRAFLLAAAALAACATGPTRKQREAAEIHSGLGLEALRAGRPADALRAFDEALKNDPDLPEANLGRGLALEFGHGRTEEAERAYRRAIALRPAYSEAHNNLGQLLARQGKLEPALREFDLALENMHYAEPFAARCNKGQALYRLGRKEEGLADLRACLAQNPRFCVGHREMGRLLADDGKVREALASFQRYAETCDREADAWFQLGLAQQRLGNAEAAREAFARCGDLQAPGDLPAECRRRRDLLK